MSMKRASKRRYLTRDAARQAEEQEEEQQQREVHSQQKCGRRRTHADSQLLPDDILAWGIFILLPLRQLVQLRTLSISLNKLLRCEPLLQTWRPTHDCWLIMAKLLPLESPKQVSEQLLALNIVDSHPNAPFFKMPLHKALSPILISSLSRTLSHHEPSARVHQVASSGGLISALIRGDLGARDHYKLVVFNPLTGIKKVINKPRGKGLTLGVGLVLDMITHSDADGSQSYHIILQDGRFKLDIYNSVTKKWKFVVDDPMVMTGDFKSADLILDCFDDDDKEESVLLGYNVKQEEWSESYAYKPWDNNLDDEVCYIRHKGRTYMVGGLSSTVRTRGQAMRLAQIYLLEGERWVEVSSFDECISYTEPPEHPEWNDDDPYDVIITCNKKVRARFLLPDVSSSYPSIQPLWQKFLISPPPSIVALSMFVPSFTAKP